MRIKIIIFVPQIIIFLILILWITIKINIFTFKYNKNKNICTANNNIFDINAIIIIIIIILSFKSTILFFFGGNSMLDLDTSRPKPHVGSGYVPSQHHVGLILNTRNWLKKSHNYFEYSSILIENILYLDTRVMKSPFTFHDRWTMLGHIHWFFFSTIIYLEYTSP